MSYDNETCEWVLQGTIPPPPQPEKNYHNRIGRLVIEFEWTPSYCWYLIPTIEINTSIKEVALNIFCLGIYIGWRESI